MALPMFKLPQASSTGAICWHVMIGQGPQAIMNDRIAPTTVIVRHNGIKSTQLDDGVVLFDLRGEALVSLNGVASQIWSLLAEPSAIEDIHQALAELYQVTAKELHSEVNPFLETLLTRRMVRIVASRA